MSPKWRMIAVALTLLSSVEAAAQIYLGADLGTSFSPHGMGASLGYSWPEGMALEMGTGISKNQRAGFPLSLEARVFLPPSDYPTFFVGLGSTYYQGSGERPVAYNSIEHQSGYIVQSDANWRTAYVRANVDAIVPGPTSKSKWFGDVGIASVAYAYINASPTGNQPRHKGAGFTPVNRAQV